MPKVAYEELKSFGRRLLGGLGFAEADADYIAETSTLTQAGGVQTHGSVLLSAIESQCGKLIDAKAQPLVVRELPAMALLDGNGAAGAVCMRLAVELGRAKARQVGSAVICARNTTWIGGLGGYIVPLARDGFFVQLSAQSSKCQDTAPAGGIDPCFSTNPIAFAWPAADQVAVADFSTAVMSMGKVTTLARAGKTAHCPVFLEKDGQLSDDPNVMLGGGAMLPAGGDCDGHKGYAMAFWIEALTAMAGGNCNDPQLEQRQSFTLTVIWADAFGNTDWLRSEMARMAGRIRNVRPRPGHGPVRLPGERFFAAVEKSRRDGVELSEPLLASLNKAAAKAGCPALAGG